MPSASGWPMGWRRPRTRSPPRRAAAILRRPRFTAANEALSEARENRAGLAARAENEDARRIEMARTSGERFQCPPPHLPETFGFDGEAIAAAETESERWTA